MRDKFFFFFGSWPVLRIDRLIFFQVSRHTYTQERVYSVPIINFLSLNFQIFFSLSLSNKNRRDSEGYEQLPAAIAGKQERGREHLFSLVDQRYSLVYNSFRFLSRPKRSARRDPSWGKSSFDTFPFRLYLLILFSVKKEGKKIRQHKDRVAAQQQKRQSIEREREREKACLPSRRDIKEGRTELSDMWSWQSNHEALYAREVFLHLSLGMIFSPSAWLDSYFFWSSEQFSFFLLHNSDDRHSRRLEKE